MKVQDPINWGAFRQTARPHDVRCGRFAASAEDDTESICGNSPDECAEEARLRRLDVQRPQEDGDVCATRGRRPRRCTSVSLRTHPNRAGPRGTLSTGDPRRPLHRSRVSVRANHVTTNLVKVCGRSFTGTQNWTLLRVGPRRLSRRDKRNGQDGRSLQSLSKSDGGSGGLRERHHFPGHAKEASAGFCCTIATRGPLFRARSAIHLDRKTFLTSLKSAPRGSSSGPEGGHVSI